MYTVTYSSKGHNISSGNWTTLNYYLHLVFFSFLSERWTDREVMYISYIGNLFLRMLKALILPLIIPSLVAAVGSLDMSLSGKVRPCAAAAAADLLFYILHSCTRFYVRMLAQTRQPLIKKLLLESEG